MKFSTLAALALALVAPAIAGPAASPEAAAMPKELGTRAPCYHSSTCSWFNAAKCEQYCRRWGQDVGVSRMEKCNLLNQKRCCCSKQ